jgi:hypothetical protein
VLVWMVCVDIPVISSSYPCDIDMVTMLNAGFALLPARRRILPAELGISVHLGASRRILLAELGAPTAQ